MTPTPTEAIAQAEERVGRILTLSEAIVVLQAARAGEEFDAVMGLGARAVRCGPQEAPGRPEYTYPVLSAEAAAAERRRREDA